MSYIRPFKKYQSSNLQNWLFLWHRHLSTQSLKFCVFMSNSYTIDKITYLTSMFEFMLTWPFGKVMLKYQFFLNPLDSNTTENNVKWKSKQLFIWKAWLWKSADVAKKFELKRAYSKLNSKQLLVKVINFNETWMSYWRVPKHNIPEACISPHSFQDVEG